MYVGDLIPVHESRRRRLVATFDPLSQVNLIAEQYVDSDWTWLEGAEVNGVGGKAKALGSVIVPQWCLTMGGWKRDIEAVVFEKLPQNMQLLIGLPVIRHGDDRLICDQWRVHSLRLKEVLRTDVLAMVLARLAGPAESHLVLCGGLCPHLVEMLSLGCNIDKVFSVESDLSVRTTAEALWEFLVHVEPHRVEDVDWENFNFSAISSAVASPPCQPWSTRSGRAAGFEDPRSEALVACARVLTLAKEKNADVKRLLENVVVDPKLVNEAERQESLVGGEMWDLNSRDSGGPVNRRRRYFAPEASAENAICDQHLNPNWLAEEGYTFVNAEIPCLVSDFGTDNPVLMTNKYKKQKHAGADVRDRLNPGTTAGFSCAWHTVEVSAVECVKTTGSAFSNGAMWAIVRQWRVPGVRLQTAMVAAKRTSWSHEQHLAHYGNIPREQVRLELTAMGESLEMSTLKLADVTGRQHAVPFQTDAPGFVNKKVCGFR